MKFGKKLARTVKRMPLEHREKLFLDYKMLKGHIKRVVNASKAPVSNEQLREAAQPPEHYHNELLEWPLAVTSAAFDDVGDQSIIAREAEVQDGVEGELLDVIIWPITAAVTDSTIQALPLTWEGVEGWEGLESAWLSITNTDGVLEDNEIQQPISLTCSEGVNGRPSTAATAPPCSSGLEAGLEPGPNSRHMRVEGVDPAAADEPNSVFPLFYSRRNNSIGAREQNADVQMELEVRRFKRMLDVEFIKINKRFVTIFLQNGELMGVSCCHLSSYLPSIPYLLQLAFNSLPSAESALLCESSTDLGARKSSRLHIVIMRCSRFLVILFLRGRI
jgi:hypothetical protein